MNTRQKVVLLIGTLFLVFVLLFMDGMNYDGIGLVAAGGLLAVGMGIYLLRHHEP